MAEDEFNLNSLIVDEVEVQTASIMQLSMFIYEIYLENVTSKKRGKILF